MSRAARMPWRRERRSTQLAWLLSTPRRKPRGPPHGRGTRKRWNGARRGAERSAPSKRRPGNPRGHPIRRKGDLLKAAPQLQGVRVVLTRPEEGSNAWKEAFERAGAAVQSLPVIASVPPLS